MSPMPQRVTIGIDGEDVVDMLITPAAQENTRLYRYVKSLGRVYGRWLYLQEQISQNPREIGVRCQSRRMRLRLNTTDIMVLYSVFVRQDYAMDLSWSPRVIVDAGAYTGYSALYLAEKYPTARILAIEPAPSNFEVLSRNVSGVPQIVPINKALWHTKTRLKIQDGSLGHWAYTVTPEPVPSSELHGEVEAVTITDIMQEFQIQHIDVLKMDIEGAEKDVFEHSQHWISDVGVIAVELHDRIKAGSSEAFHAATRGFDFERKNEMTVFKSRVGPV